MSEYFTLEIFEKGCWKPYHKKFSNKTKEEWVKLKDDVRKLTMSSMKFRCTWLPKINEKFPF